MMSFILETPPSGCLRNSLVEPCSRQLETLCLAWEESRAEMMTQMHPAGGGLCSLGAEGY